MITINFKIMNKYQITKYKYCETHLQQIKTYLKNLPFKIQKYGCGSNVPNIEHQLEEIHKEMYLKVELSIKEAEKKVEIIIDSI